MLFWFCHKIQLLVHNKHSQLTLLSGKYLWLHAGFLSLPVSKPPFSSLISIKGRMEYRVLSCDDVCLLTYGEEPLCWFLSTVICMHSTGKKKSLQIKHSTPFSCKAHVQYALHLACKYCNYMDTSPQHVSCGCSREHQVFPNVSCERARLLLPVASQNSTDIHAMLLFV